MDVEVLDSSGNPLVNYEVIVTWSDGISRDRTNSNGIYKTGVNSGTVKSISVEGRNVYSSSGRYVSGETISVTY